jgi:hypothetical protein
VAPLKSHDKYRFGLQWSSDTEDRRLAGELLERLGNRKSEVVVAALCDYARSHPEVLTARTVKLVINQSLTSDQLESMVKKLIAEKMAGLEVRETASERNSFQNSPQDDAAITSMLENLDIFASQ